MTDQLYPVAAHLTQAEYEARRQLPGRAGAVRLTGTSRYSELPYGEEHLPMFIRDAAIAAGIAQPATTTDFAAEYNCSVWPFPLKTLIMDEAESLWIPPAFANDSEWTGTP